VLLSDVRQPVLSLYALEDHIVPPSACAALRDRVGSGDYTECTIATGHIGMYVSRAARREIPARIISWLRERGEQGGRPQRRAARRASGRGTLDNRTQ
jgi:polyhydroxyalkanoate synthase